MKDGLEQHQQGRRFCGVGICLCLFLLNVLVAGAQGPIFMEPMTTHGVLGNRSVTRDVLDY